MVGPKDAPEDRCRESNHGWIQRRAVGLTIKGALADRLLVEANRDADRLRLALSHCFFSIFRDSLPSERLTDPFLWLNRLHMVTASINN
jgi:hypothetical protein